MANRLSKITTRTGDSGTTGLGDGSRIHKSAARVEALGDVDELNSSLGVLLTVDMRAEHRDLLIKIQNALFDLGGELSIPTWRAITEAHLLVLDNAIAELNEALPPLKEFILPGGSVPAAHCHVSRTVARRAERRVATLMAANEDVSPLALQYLNRLSDLLFVLARVLNRDTGIADVCWTREPASSPAPAPAI
jgi:cob(I)alamin adenosyltransferase